MKKPIIIISIIALLVVLACGVYSWNKGDSDGVIFIETTAEQEADKTEWARYLT